MSTTFDSDGLALEDLLELIRVDVTENVSNFARRNAVPLLRDSSVTVKTAAGADEEDYEHTYSVISRIPNPANWVMPRDRMIFEPHNIGALRHNYHPNQYRPLEMILTIDGRARRYKWQLDLEKDPARYDAVRNDTSDFIYVSNKTTWGAGDRFTIFHYVHEDDLARHHPARIFYKVEGDWMHLHCVSIPLKLLSMLINNYNDDDLYKF